MDISNRWGAAVGNLISAGMLIVAVSFTIALVLMGLGAVIRAWHYLMGA